ncbi:hypothetical protein KOW79_008776 [Hemibagrus wyckioides]|uniref:Uncharacterized protein n=1 Tax=Hemibagrus wyckioides TaxID=337641 RepID=A0A9D3SKQ0_9TELE|nr:hypothetical protein KOW79_008776 [Hemibagrus wyckioides]
MTQIAELLLKSRVDGDEEKSWDGTGQNGMGLRVLNAEHIVSGNKKALQPVELLKPAGVKKPRRRISDIHQRRRRNFGVLGGLKQRSVFISNLVISIICHLQPPPPPSPAPAPAPAPPSSFLPSCSDCCPSHCFSRPLVCPSASSCPTLLSSGGC